MSVAYICDGCGTASAEEPEELGTVVKRHYCGQCKPNAQAFLEDEEALRIELHESFLEKRAQLIEARGNGTFKFPDVLNGD
jgi:hypothetical protein